MKNKNLSTDINIDKLFQDSMFMINIIQPGINAALLKHKQAGNPICTWKDDKVVWIQPEDIHINGEPDKHLEGKRELFTLLLETKFGPLLSADFLNKINELTSNEISELSKKIFTANNLHDIL